MIATPKKKIAKPPRRTRRCRSSRRFATSSSIDMLLDEAENIERPIGDGDRSGLDQLLRLMIAPACPDSRGARGGGHRHVEAGVADDNRRLWRSTAFNDGLLHHRRMRLGRVTIGGLQRDEAGVDAVLFQAM